MPYSPSTYSDDDSIAATFYGGGQVPQAYVPRPYSPQVPEYGIEASRKKKVGSTGIAALEDAAQQWRDVLTGYMRGPAAPQDSDLEAMRKKKAGRPAVDSAPPPPTGGFGTPEPRFATTASATQYGGGWTPDAGPQAPSGGYVPQPGGSNVQTPGGTTPQFSSLPPDAAARLPNQPQPPDAGQREQIDQQQGAPQPTTGEGGIDIAGPPPEIPFTVNNPEAEAYWRTRGGAPKPLNTEDAVVFASWARTFGDEFMPVTAQDVTDYRNNPNGMHFTEWWRAKQAAATPGGELPMPQKGGKPDPTQGGTPEGGAQQPEMPYVVNNPESEAYWRARGGAPKPQGTEDANIAASWYRTFPVVDAEKITGEAVTRYRNWALQNGVTDPDYGHFKGWWEKIDSITRGGMFAGGAEPLGGPGPVLPAMPPAPELQQPPPVTPPPATPPPPPSAPAGPFTSMPYVDQLGPEAPQAPSPEPKISDPDPFPQPQGPNLPGIGDAVKNLNALFQPGFEREQERLLRLLMHQGGVSGMLDSGGFTATVGDQLSGLIANQGQRMGDYMFKDKQSQDALAMQKYIADQENRTRLKELETNTGMQRYIADLNNDLERYKVVTNSDLQKMLAEQENTLKRYGIDKDDLLQRYIADLRSKDQRYASDAGVNAASLQAAAAGAAQAAAGAARQAEMEFQRERLKYEDVFNQRQYDLGLLGINRDIYQTDLENQYKLMMLQWYMSPEARIGGSAPTVPGVFPYGP